MAQPVSDNDRTRLEEEIAAALLLIYAGHRNAALAGLGVTAATGDVPSESVQKVHTFATDRAAKIQDGINSRMNGADDAAATAAAIATYNHTVLQPFMESWARHQGTIDAFTETPDPGGSGQSAAAAAQWSWQQNTDFQDDCTEAMAASPAPLDDLLGITGGPPPVHERCQCDLSPA